MKNKFVILAGVVACIITGGSLYVSYNLHNNNVNLKNELDETKKGCENLKAENKTLSDNNKKLDDENKALKEKVDSLEGKPELNEGSVETPNSFVGQTQTTQDIYYEQPVSAWDGQALTPQAGTIIGPSGKETYYNLPMDGVLSIMRGTGNNDPYWVRGDGVKMLGDYVMVAADLNTNPRGSLVSTSLGMGIVCDTGNFAATNPTQLDIAVSW